MATDNPFSARTSSSRRGFLELATAGAVALAGLVSRSDSLAADPSGARPSAAPTGRKIRLGVIGCGSRGQWVSKYFQQHGGYEIHAACDYFQDIVNKFGTTFGVDKSRCFSGLLGYRRLLESGVDAVALEGVPYFYPEQAQAAVETGRHVFIAKPVAVDVPGTLAIGAAAALATRKQLCFLVDYQMPTDPVNVEIAQRIADGALGDKLSYLVSSGGAPNWRDAPAGSTVEQRLRGGNWLRDITLSADSCVAFDIHSIDAMLWIIKQKPVSATGYSRVTRPNPQLEGRDVVHVMFHFADGLVWTHMHQSLNNNCDMYLACHLYGPAARAVVPYKGKACIHGGLKHYVGNVENLYEAGVQRNVAQFYKSITESHFENASAQRAVVGTLTAILGREAGYRQGQLTMEELLKENKKLVLDVSGLKA